LDSLSAGELAVVCCAFFVAIPQALLGVLTALFLGVMTFLIFAVDHPFQGVISVGPDPFQSVYGDEVG
jgi:hypothetical protein